MSYVELLIQYNGFFLIFNSIGFLFSLVWFLISEKSQREKLSGTKKLKKKDLFDEKVFFGEFDNIENPAMQNPDLKPIFDNIAPNQYKKDEDMAANDKNQIKIEGLPKFPILKPQVKENLKTFLNTEVDSNKDENGDVQGLLDKIKKDLKNRKG